MTEEGDYDQFDILIVIERLFKRLNLEQQNNLLRNLREKMIITESEKQNKHGGERAKCPKCAEYQDKAYEFMKEDWRQFECEFCKKSSQHALYFPNSISELKENKND